MNKIASQFSTIEQVTEQYLKSKSTKENIKSDDIDFETLLKQKQSQQIIEGSSLKFSKHAAMRITDRQIDFTENQNQRLETGVQLAKEKGIQDSLVLVDSLAFIVNVPNQTVVTAMDKRETINNVFTNIDGAIIT